MRNGLRDKLAYHVQLDLLCSGAIRSAVGVRITLSMCKKGIVRGNGLLLQGVQACVTDLTVFQCPDKIFLVNDSPTCCVDNHGRILHFTKCITAEYMGGFGS